MRYTDTLIGKLGVILRRNFYSSYSSGDDDDDDDDDEDDDRDEFELEIRSEEETRSVNSKKFY